MRRFTDLDREEVRRMFKLHDLRESRVWQEAHKEGKEEGREEGIAKGRQEGRSEEKQDLVKRWISSGKTHSEIADLLGLPLSQVRRLARQK